MAERPHGSIGAACAVPAGPDGPLHAQVATGTILGNVKDNSGAPVPGAQVTATNLGTQVSRTATTDADGQYALTLLPVGNYKVEVTLSGFKNFSQTGIVLEVGRNARIDATIEPGNVRSRVGHRRRAARRNQFVGAVAHGGTERGPEPSAGQPRSLLAADDHRRRDEQRELELARRSRAAHDDQRISERADRHRQLPARWRQQHGGPAWHREPGAEP